MIPRTVHSHLMGGMIWGSGSALHERTEVDNSVNPAGAKAIGELANVGTAAAVVSAVFHATGQRIRELPITNDKLILG